MPEPEGETKAEQKLLLCLGLGYVAARLAQRLTPLGWRVLGTTRAGGDGRIAFEGNVEEPLRAALRSASAVLVSIPPGPAGCPAFSALQKDLARATPSWIGYLSTTGVYGDRAGRWAFEDDRPTPHSLEAERRVLAEIQWRSLPTPAHIFRLPGIYGPFRSPFDRLRAGAERRIDKPGQVFSRAHVDDIADALARSIARPNPGRVYNVCDDRPAPSADVIAFAAELLGVPAPPLTAFEAAQLSPMSQRFYSECKRVSNARLKAELGWRPTYPTFREGLRHCLQEETSATS